MIIPVASTPKQLLEQNGQPVNVDTSYQAVMATAPGWNHMTEKVMTVDSI